MQTQETSPFQLPSNPVSVETLSAPVGRRDFMSRPELLDDAHSSTFQIDNHDLPLSPEDEEVMLQAVADLESINDTGDIPELAEFTKTRAELSNIGERLLAVRREYRDSGNR